jgi:hypothetical protein
LHQPSLKLSIERDFTHLPDLIAKSSKQQETKEDPPENKSDPTQLSLF